ATDLVEGCVPLQADDDPGEPAHHDDDADGSTEHRQGADAEGHFRDQTQHLVPVVDDRLGNPADSPQEEGELVTQGVERVDRATDEGPQPGPRGSDIGMDRHYDPFGGTICRYTAVRMRLAK